MGLGDIVQKIIYKGDASDANKASESLSKNMRKAFKNAALQLVAYQKIASVATREIQKAVKSALEYERTTLALQAALRNQNLEVGNNTQLLALQASELQRLTNISDETIRGMQALAINMGVGADKADDFVRAAVRLSNTTGIDATQAMRQLVKTLSGLQGELGEALPSVRALTKEQLTAGKAVEVINKEMRENLGLMTEGTAGKIKSLGAAWSNYTEEVAKAAAATTSFNRATSALDRASLITRHEGLLAGFSALIFDSEAARKLAEGLAKEEEATVKSLKALRDTEAQSAMNRGEPLTLEPLNVDIAAEQERQRKAADARRKAADEAARQREENIRIEEEAIARQREIDIIAQDEHQRVLDERIDAEREYFEKLAEMREEDAEKKRELDRRAEAESKSMKAAELRELQKQAAFATSLATKFTDVFMVAMEAASNGQRVQFEELAKNFLKTTGKQLVASGIQHSLMSAFTLDVHGATIALAEISAGLAMMSGALILPGGGGLGGGAAGAGGSFSAPSRGGGSQEPTSTNITIVGALSAEETALLVQRGMNRAADQGIT